MVDVAILFAVFSMAFGWAAFFLGDVNFFALFMGVVYWVMFFDICWRYNRA